MGISPRVVAALRRQGHNALPLQEQDLGYIPDPEILAKARAHGLAQAGFLEARGGKVSLLRRDELLPPRPFTAP